MPGWTLVETHPTQGRTFQRPLDGVELVTFWDTKFNGTADNLHHVELRLPNPSQDADLFSEANIIKAWLSTKRRYPLAGASIRVLPARGGDGVLTFISGPHLVVREHDLAELHPNEIIFGKVACKEEVQQRITEILDGPRSLSDDLLAQLYVFRETDPKRTDTLHLMTLIAHCVTDGMANRSLMRCLLDTLARSGRPDSELAQIPLEKRLAMAVSIGDIQPAHLKLLSLARRRWRRAIATIIFKLRMEKGQGGYTLPCRYTRATPHTLARSGFVSTVLTESQTSTVIANCRQHGLTFGNAYLVLGQVAMTRVLYRRYLRGEISEEEWEYRQRQPYRTLGPVNLRPYLDKTWFENGGGGEFTASFDVSINLFPFMTMGETRGRDYRARDLPNGAPWFSDLLTFNRFLYRAGLAKKQTKAFFNHPLFLEILRACNLEFSGHTHRLALEWQKRTENANDVGTHGRSEDDDKVLAVADMPFVIAHGGSTLGNLHLIFPMEYPLPSTHPLSPYSPVPHPTRAGYATPPAVPEGDTTPRIIVEDAMTRLHTRPAELYLGALTLRGQMKMYVFYDRNVYEDGVVQEWLDEVRGAVQWYLGETHGPLVRGAEPERARVGFFTSMFTLLWGFLPVWVRQYMSGGVRSVVQRLWGLA